MIWNDYIAYAAGMLASAGVDDAKTNAEYLAMNARGMKSRAELRAKLSDKIKYNHAVTFSQIVFRRMCREPLQYILGEWEFYGLPIKVSHSVLIPRPETEILVEQAHDEALYMPKHISILDIGTGSGAIALALVANIPHAKVCGIDSSGKAILIAKENMKRLRLQNVVFFKRNLFSNKWEAKQTKKFNIIVSNPPYVSITDFETLPPEIRLHEPPEALTDGSTGLTFYKRIASIAPRLLKKRGVVIVEIGFGAEKVITEIFTSAGFEVQRIVPDLAGISRVLIAKVASHEK